MLLQDWDAASLARTSQLARSVPSYAFSTATVEIRSESLLTMGAVALYLSEIYLSLYRHVQ